VRTAFWNLWRSKAPQPARLAEGLSPEAGRRARAARRAQRLRDRAAVAEDLTEWRELMAEAERLDCPSAVPADGRRHDEP
jgi:hypothetical protein